MSYQGLLGTLSGPRGPLRPSSRQIYNFASQPQQPD